MLSIVVKNNDETKYECFSNSKYPYLLSEMIEILSEISDENIEIEIFCLLKRISGIGI